MKKIMELLPPMEELVTLHLKESLDLLIEPKIQEILSKNIENKNTETKLGFNLFRLISDTYYKENFHSDILKAFLDTNELHDEGNLFLNEFLRFLLFAGASLNINDYTNAKVFRESGRIDILIEDNISRKAIIIENKINNAPDQYRQLPRYVEHEEIKGYEVDCVVYLLLTHYIDPKMDGWTDDEKIKIKPLIKSIASYNNNQINLLDNWIKECERLTENDHTRFILIQYQELLKQLAGQIMNKQLMEKFYENMIIDDHFNTAMSLKSMLEDLTQHRLEKLFETFKDNCAPFESVGIYKNIAVVFVRGKYKDSLFQIDIVVEPNKYKLQIVKQGNITLATLIQSLELEKDFSPVNDRIQRVFEFPKQEQDLYSFVNNFKDKLKNSVTQ